MPAALRRMVAVLLVCSAAVLLGALAAEARPAGTVDDEAGFVAKIGAERAGAGLRSYSTASDLVAVARRHAQRMAVRGEPYHNPNLSTEVTGWSVVGENVGKGLDVDSLHRAFMGSPAHRANILSTEFTQVGVGVARSADGWLYVVQVFRRPMEASAPAPAPAAAPAPPPAPAAPARPSPPPPPPAPTTSTVPPTTTTLPPTTTTVAAPEPDVELAVALAPAATAVEASITLPGPPSMAGPATVAAVLIAALLPALVRARRQLLSPT
jgi:hypothetical protein